MRYVLLILVIVSWTGMAFGQTISFNPSNPSVSCSATPGTVVSSYSVSGSNQILTSAMVDTTSSFLISGSNVVVGPSGINQSACISTVVVTVKVPSGTSVASNNLSVVITGVPPPAAAAGFTAQVLSANFTVPGNFWSNPANYVTNCGAAASVPNQPSTWHFNYRMGVTNNVMPCSDTAIVTDPDFGGQVLNYKLKISEWSSAGSYLSWPAWIGMPPGAGGVTWLPNEVYTKIVIRLSSTSFNQPGNNPCPGSCGGFDWWSTSQFGTAWADIDWAEIAYPPPPTQFVGEIQSGDHNGNSAFSDFVKSPLNTDVTQYHTIEGLTTSDEASVLEMCLWFDGVFAGCAGVSMPFDGGYAYTTHDRSLDLTSMATNVAPTNDVNIYIKSIEAWSCPNYITQTCPGTVVNHWPFP